MSNSADFHPLSWKSASTEDLLDRIRESGIVGMGGAGFPAHEKIRRALLNDRRIAIGNGMESDPGVTADRTLVLTHPAEVLEGLAIVAKILGTNDSYIAVPHNKLFERLDTHNEYSCQVQLLGGSAQAGEERTLIEALTTEKVPFSRYPAEFGIVVFNVATLFAIRSCIVEGCKPKGRFVTVLGTDSWQPTGVPLQSIVDTDEALQVGGRATGRSADCNEVLEPTVNAICIDKSSKEMPCIHCGWCTSACPKDLPVEHLYEDAAKNVVSSLSNTYLDLCNECGACVVACPSNISLLNYLRTSRTRIHDEEERKLQAIAARNRFESREKRLANVRNATLAERQQRMSEEHQWS